MKIDIQVYGLNAFTKTGKLKKKAPTQWGATLIDTEPYEPNMVDDFIKETAKQLKEHYTGFESPYFFTHIQAKSKATGEPVFIFEDCNGLITSPTTLLAKLTA